MLQEYDISFDSLDFCFASKISTVTQMPHSTSFLILRIFHYYYDKTHCLYWAVSRNKFSLAILGELHVL